VLDAVQGPVMSACVSMLAHPQVQGPRSFTHGTASIQLVPSNNCVTRQYQTRRWPPTSSSTQRELATHHFLYPTRAGYPPLPLPNESWPPTTSSTQRALATHHFIYSTSAGHPPLHLLNERWPPTTSSTQRALATHHFLYSTSAGHPPLPPLNPTLVVNINASPSLITRTLMSQ
jgi:hypothetical protein